MTDHVLDSWPAKLRGVIGREPEEGERYFFVFDDVRDRDVHMVGVRKPLRVKWLIDGELVHSETLRPWTGYASARADLVIEEAVGQ